MLQHLTTTELNNIQALSLQLVRHLHPSDKEALRSAIRQLSPAATTELKALWLAGTRYTDKDCPSFDKLVEHASAGHGGEVEFFSRNAGRLSNAIENGCRRVGIDLNKVEEPAEADDVEGDVVEEMEVE